MYGLEVKVKAIRLARDSNYSYREIGRILGVDHKTIKQWTIPIRRQNTVIVSRKNNKHYTINTGNINRHSKQKIIIGGCVQGREKTLEELFSIYLIRKGYKAIRQVSCKAGIVDIVSDDAIYEVKSYLTLSDFKDAIGQVLLYRQCINPRLKAFIVCWGSEVGHLHNLVKELGVTIIVFDNSMREF